MEKIKITKGGSMVMGDTIYNLKSFSKIRKWKPSILDKANAKASGEDIGKYFLEFTEQNGEAWNIPFGSEKKADDVLKKIHKVL